MHRPVVWSFAALFVFGCSSSSSGSSGGCGSNVARVCKIDTSAMLCPNRITLICFEGATPEAKDQCTAALKQDTQVVYCCTSNAESASADGEGGGGPTLETDEGR